MLAERHTNQHFELSPKEEVYLVSKITKISSLDYKDFKSDKYLGDIKEIINTFDPRLSVHCQDLEFDKDGSIRVGNYIVRKVESDENYKLILTDFLDYDANDVDCVYQKVPGVRITYDRLTKEPVRIDKMTVNATGRLFMGAVFKKG